MKNKFRFMSLTFLFVYSFIFIMDMAFASEPRNVRISNVGADRFTISWTTDAEEGAQINYGTTVALGKVAYDARGESFVGTTHYITITGLNSNAAYYYDIVSGGVHYDNGSSHYTITTGAPLDPRAGSDIAYGQVFLSGGPIPALGAIVYIKLNDNNGQETSGESQLCSSLVGSTGDWYMEFNNIRDETLGSYFEYSASGDNVVLEAIGPTGESAFQVVDTSGDAPAPAMTLGPGYWMLNMSEMRWYENSAPYNSTGAATCQMILNYIREGAGEPLLTQNEIYEYAKSPLAYGTELDADEVDKALGHFDPYDYLVSNWADRYDSLSDGNLYQGYNFTVDTYDPNTNPEAMNEYMRDICHWMAYTVTKEDWWLDGELVARPNTPAALPVYGQYSNWVAVKGYAANKNPSPDPHTDPYKAPDFTVYGFWIKDPLVSGIGQNTYKTAAECEATYFQPLTTGDAYDGLLVQVAEPPAQMSRARVDIPKPAPDLANLEFIGIDAGTGTLEVASASTETKVYPAGKRSWRDLVDQYLLTDSEAVSAFEGAEMGKPILVKSLDAEGSDYCLAPFNKKVKEGLLTSAVIILDAKEGYFKEASWTKNPEKFLKVDKKEAIILIRRYIIKNYYSEVRRLLSRFGDRRPPPGYAWFIYRKILPKYTRLLGYLGKAQAELVWGANSYSPSPYKPFWKVDINGYIWYVTQESDVTSEIELKIILDEKRPTSTPGV